MTSFYSHSKKDTNDVVSGSKLLHVHTQGVTNNAIESLHKHTNLTMALPLADIAGLVCLYHDLGKYTTHFQNYLLKTGPFNQTLKQHAKFGGFALYQKLRGAGYDQLALFALFLIVHHHGNLTNIADLRDFAKRFSIDADVFEKQLATIQPYLSAIGQEIGESELARWLCYPDKELRKLSKEPTERNPDIQNYFLCNYLFSLLIEADKLDASDTILYQRIAFSPTLVNNRLGASIFIPHTPNVLQELSQKELRDYVRGAVLQQLSDPKILDKRLFTLTAPTGIGKTLTALDFSLRLKAQIRNKEGYEPQLIYALPFINIIEQALAEYRRVLGDNGQLLAHYQYADALEQLPRKGENNENSAYNQKTMLLDTWQSDVVITTFVQFLQTLIGNRNKLLKKFHHLAGAIVILDEVQTIRLEQLPLVGAALFYLAKFLNTRIILMTATKPKTFSLAEREILSFEGDKLVVTELLAEHEAVFKAFKRTKIVPLINLPIANEETFVNQHFAERWSSEKSCLIVCNVVKRSIDLYEQVREYVASDNRQNTVYYLSTNIIPAHRLYIIERVKLDLQYGLKPILIATQCVEAGVDLDFDMGFRDLGPIDSIIQVAGRINRENSPTRKHSPLYVVDFEDCTKIYDPITNEQARLALQKGMDENGEILEENYLALIGRYYDDISVEGRKSFQKSRKIFDSMKRLNYDNEQKDTYPVSSFQVIDEKGFAVSVFIEIDQQATAAKNAFLQLIHKKFDKAEFDTKHKLTFNQRVISVPKYLAKVGELKQAGNANELIEGLYIVNHSELAEYYDEITGFERSKSEKSNAQSVLF